MNPLSDRLSLGFSSIGHFYSHFFMLLYPTAVIALESVFSAPYHELIGLMFLGNLMFGLCAIPAGYLGDRWSATGMMVVFFLGTGAMSILTGFANSLFQIAAGLTAIGFFAAIYHPVGIAWVVRHVANRGKALGINGVFGSLGVGSAPLVAALLADLGSWRLAFILPGIVCVATGLLLAFGVWRGWIENDTKKAAPAPAETTRKDMQRGALALAITVCCSGLIYQATSFALPKLFENRLGSGDALFGIGLLVSAIYFCSGGAQIAGGWLADRFNKKRVYVTAWIIQIPFLIIVASIDSWLLFPVSVVMVLSNTIAVPTENALFARFTPPAWRGTAFGVKFLLTLGVSAGAVPLLAWVYSATGDFTWLFLILGGLAATAFAAALLLPAGEGEPEPELAPEPAE
jgi:MFS family permease